SLDVRPRRRHEWNSAGQRLERPERRGSGKSGGIRAPGGVNGDLGARKHLRGTVVGDPPPGLDTSGVDDRPCLARRVYAVEGEAQGRQARGGVDEVILARLPAFPVAPFTDPDDVVGVREGERSERGDVGGRVKGPHVLVAVLVAIHVSERVPGRENNV